MSNEQSVQLARLLMLAVGFGVLTVSWAALGQEAFGPLKTAFDRIIPGWTNYSTAFNATHDSGAAGDFASVAAFYAPATDVRLEEFSVIVIGGGTRAPDFARFQFRVLVWSGLEALIREPRVGDVATWDFVAPTGGSIAVPDARTRGGRGAYLLRFGLSHQLVLLEAGHEWLVGFAARADTQTADELFVPSSSHEGRSDVQAGDLVAGGWRYLAEAGGSTIYSGQLAMSLAVTPRLERPRIQMTRTGRFVELSWPATASDYVLESSLALEPAGAGWIPVEIGPEEVEGMMRVVLPASLSRQWFRLRR